MLLVGLGTPLCFYSLLFWEHTLAAFLFALSLLFAVRAFHVRRIQNVAWCGVFAGAAPWFRTEMLLALAAMACAFAVMAPTWRIRVLVLAFFSVGAGLLGIPLVIFNLRAYGGLFGAHYLQNIQLDQAVSGGITWFGTLWVKLDVLSRHLLFGREFFNVRGNDVLVFAPFVAAILLWLAPRFAWKRVAQAVILCLAAGVGVYVALTSATVVGFFAASPAMVLAFAGANPIRLWRGRIAFRARGLSFCVLVCGIYALFLFATSPVLGGVQFGPRFLLPLYVPAALLAARTATPPGLGPGWTRRLSFVSGLVLVACSSMMGARGMIFAHQQKAIAGYVKDTIAQTDCRIVVSDMQILALTGPIYFDRIMFCAPDEQALRRLETLLSGRGERLFLFVTRSVKPVGPVGITVAAANAPEVPVMRAGEVRFILGPIEGLGEVLSAGH
jgi:hypothetical protein